MERIRKPIALEDSENEPLQPLESGIPLLTETPVIGEQEKEELRKAKENPKLAEMVKHIDSLIGIC